MLKSEVCDFRKPETTPIPRSLGDRKVHGAVMDILSHQELNLICGQRYSDLLSAATTG